MDLNFMKEKVEKHLILTQFCSSSFFWHEKHASCTSCLKHKSLKRGINLSIEVLMKRSGFPFLVVICTNDSQGQVDTCVLRERSESVYPS